MDMNKELDKRLLIELEIVNVLSTYFNLSNNVFDSGTSYNFRCNVCRDSEKSKIKKRGHIYKNNEQWMYHCYNCNYHTSAENWLKTFFNYEYKNVLMELAKMTKSNQKSTYIEIEKKIKNIKFNTFKKKFDEKEHVSFFRKIINYPDLIKYCKDRKIPENVYMKWFYATGGFYKYRLIIPFYDSNDKIYYYQGRDVTGKSENKYLSRMGENLISIYNYYNVDKSSVVIVVEGPIDAEFVENCVAVTGLKKSNNLEVFPKKYYLLDNDKSGFDKSIKLLQNGEYVFMWNMFLKDYPCCSNVKDVNDFIKYNPYGITKLTFPIIKKYFTNNVLHKVLFIWK